MKRNVKFNKDRRMSRSSMSDDEKSNGPKSPTRTANGNPARPDYDRTDTGGGDWATENEGEDQKVRRPFEC